MKVGDLVSHEINGVGVIVEISEPTVIFPYQIAKLLFVNGQIKELTTSVLSRIKDKQDK